MRIVIMFDLPTQTKEQKDSYIKFRRNLIQNGYIMLQYSVYTKISWTVCTPVGSSSSTTIFLLLCAISSLRSRSMPASSIGRNDDKIFTSIAMSFTILFTFSSLPHPPAFQNTGQCPHDHLPYAHVPLRFAGSHITEPCKEWAHRSHELY